MSNKKITWTNVALATFTILVPLYAYELFFTFKQWHPRHLMTPYYRRLLENRWDAAEKRGIPFDRRKISQVLKDTAGRERPLYPYATFRMKIDNLEAFAIAGELVFPLGGIPDEDTLLCNETGAYAEYHADEHGFRNPKGLYDSGAEVALVGDSFTHGACVRDGETISDFLRPFFTVQNLGATGSGPVRELATAVEYLSKRPPKTLVWIYFEGNDPTDFQNELKYPLMRRYLEEPDFSQGLYEKKALLKPLLIEVAKRSISAQPRDRWGTLKATLLFEVMTLSTIRKQVSHLLSMSKLRAEYRSVLEMAKRRFPETRILVAFLPSFESVVSARVINQTDKALVERSARELGLEYLDLSEPLFSRSQRESLYPLNLSGHFTAEGYGVVASAIAKRLRAMPAPGDGTFDRPKEESSLRKRKL